MRQIVLNTIYKFDGKNLYLKKINQTCLEKIYADNKSKRFQIRKSENASTKSMSN